MEKTINPLTCKGEEMYEFVCNKFRDFSIIEKFEMSGNKEFVYVTLVKGTKAKDYKAIKGKLEKLGFFKNSYTDRITFQFVPTEHFREDVIGKCGNNEGRRNLVGVTLEKSGRKR